MTTKTADECWSDNGSEFYYSSLGELIDCHHDDLSPGSIVYRGEPVTPDPTVWFDADDLIERLAERAFDEHHEFAEGWPPEIAKEVKDELNAFIDAWVEKHCKPTFYGVENVKPYTITAEDLQE